MKLVSLASGSSGNAFLVDSGSGLLLLDVGISYRLLKEEMERITPPPVAGIPVSFSVPLLVEANAARTWAEAH